MTHQETDGTPDVLVVGAGIAGLACARVLRDAGMRVTLVERRAMSRLAAMPAWLSHAVIPVAGPCSYRDDVYGPLRRDP